jgi:hypothetical protein
MRIVQPASFRQVGFGSYAEQPLANPWLGRFDHTTSVQPRLFVAGVNVELPTEVTYCEAAGY